MKGCLDHNDLDSLFYLGFGFLGTWISPPDETPN